MRYTAIFAFIVLLCSLRFLSAGDDGLYENLFPAESGFIRFIGTEGQVAVVNGTRVEIPTNRITDYQNVPVGLAKIHHGSARLEVEIHAQTHLSAMIMSDGSLRVFEETIVAHPGKSDVLFINMSDQKDLTLFVPEAEAALFEGITTYESRAIAIRAPLSLSFQVRQGDTVLGTLAPVSLRRKEGLTIVFSETEGRETITAVRHGYAR